MLCRFTESLIQAAQEGEDEKIRHKHFKDKVKEKDMREKSALDAFMSLKGAGDVLIFLSGRQGIPAEGDETMERAFCRALLRACGVMEKEFNTPVEFIRHLDKNASADENKDRKIWIILDAVNEVERFRDFAKYLGYIHDRDCQISLAQGNLLLENRRVGFVSGEFQKAEYSWDIALYR